VFGIGKLKERVAELEHKQEATVEDLGQLRKDLVRTGVLQWREIDLVYGWATRKLAVPGVDVGELHDRFELLAEALGYEFVNVPAQEERVEVWAVEHE